MTETSTAAKMEVGGTEGVVMETSPVEVISPPFPVYLSTPTDVSDITKILSRPFTIDMGILPVTGNTLISRVPIGTSSLLARWSQLAEYYGIRCTVVIRLLIVATPTDAGLFGVCWDPTSGTGVATIVRKHMASLMQLPGTVFNLAQQREIELRMPWVQPYEFARLNADPVPAVGGLSWGSYTFYSITPRVAGVDSTDPSFRVMMWLEDVNLFGVRGNVLAVP